ncbi:hypothetical protein P8C59_004572 [Phyllachora maydis]|uniref:RRM domain-containing protein n=1 Tax=Phyllachora maydis TaxID=1825666 RepID=A0AAD9MDM5_9PEZI|nr:hypothetical protein P8C59_004572 [Phyllachora maydis]
MAETDNLDDDLFADLYDEPVASKAEAPVKAEEAAIAAAPAAVQSDMPDGNADDDVQAGNYANVNNENEEYEDDDDDVDFDIGGNVHRAKADEEEGEMSISHEAPPPPHPVRGPSSKEDGKMFIGGLNWETTDDSLREYFSQFGEVVECTVMRDGATGRSRGFGFLTFKDAKTVNVVMVKEHHLDGKIIDPKRAIPREEQEKTSKIFVGGVSQETTDHEFREYFAQFGRVVDATLMMDKDTGRPRGFGFVTFESEAGVDACLSTSLAIHGKPIEVKKAQPRGNLREEEEAARRGGNKFGRKNQHGANGGGSDMDDGPAGGGSNAMMAGMGGGSNAIIGLATMPALSPQVMAQNFQRMQQTWAMMQQQMRTMQNPALMQMQYMQQMQQFQQHMMAQGRNGVNAMAGMNPQLTHMQQLHAMTQQQQMMNQQGGGAGGGGGGSMSPGGGDPGQMQGGGQGPNRPGFNAYDQQQFEQQKYEQRQPRRSHDVQQQQQQQQQQHQGYGNQGFGGMGGGGGGSQGGPTSWEGMYDDVPQPNFNQGGGGGGGGRGGFQRNRGGFHQGPVDPNNAPPANAPTGPKNAGRPGANMYRGGGRGGGQRGFHPYGRG